MKRRTLLAEVGAASIATVGLVGTASARTGPAVAVDQEIDVSDVSGTVTLESILSAADHERVPAGVDPSEVELTVAEDADTITPSHCCCCGCNMDCVEACHHGCCLC